MVFLAVFFQESSKQKCLQPNSGVYSIETSEGGSETTALSFLVLECACFRHAAGLSSLASQTWDAHVSRAGVCWAAPALLFLPAFNWLALAAQADYRF